MKTVNSLSGGKTSSYIAVHYPADYEIFALVCVDCHNAGARIDKRMKQRVNDKLQKYHSQYPEFRATAEDPTILKTMFDLEQMIGREIIWVRGNGWETMLNERKAIPNMSKRFCTTILKISPIFEYLYNHTPLPVQMRIGFRYDEKDRATRFNDKFKYAYKCEYQPKSNRWIQRWNDNYIWRIGEFPLIEDKIIHNTIHEFWRGKKISFPAVSNCLNCFWKKENQLRQNFQLNNPIMQWAKIMEDLMGHTFKDKHSLYQIEQTGIQLKISI